MKNKSFESRHYPAMPIIWTCS